MPDYAVRILLEACRILGEAFEKKFPGLRRRAVSSFIILRMISPAIISPASIHIAHPSLSGAGRRALVEVSKLLVYLANDASLGKAIAPDEFAEFLSQQNIRKMAAYLDDLQVRPPSIVEPRDLTIDSLWTRRPAQKLSPQSHHQRLTTARTNSSSGSTYPAILAVSRAHQTALRFSERSWTVCRHLSCGRR